MSCPEGIEDEVTIDDLAPGAHAHIIICQPGAPNRTIVTSSPLTAIGEIDDALGAIFVTSTLNRVGFARDVLWTPAPDRTSLPLLPTANLPVAIHVISQRRSDALRKIGTDLIRLNATFASENTGMQFTVVSVDFAHGGDAMHAALNGNFSQEADQHASYLLSSMFTQGMINIYYVDKADERGDGAWQGYLDHDLTHPIIGMPVTLTDPLLLAHEMGHALGLSHVEDATSEHCQSINSQSNIMHGNSISRVHFSDGQIFRMNFSSASALITVYKLDRRHLAVNDPTDAPVFPWIGLDVWNDASASERLFRDLSRRNAAR